MRSSILFSSLVGLLVCLFTDHVLTLTNTPSVPPVTTPPTVTTPTTICPTQPTVDCEKCLTDCCEELLISIKTWEDCNCTPLNGTQAEDENYFYRRIYYKQLFIWLREYCADHNAKVKFYY